jgi:diguanylate cyclase (GGDEF)-like protein/PAS domain S-box-containing protein
MKGFMNKKISGDTFSVKSIRTRLLLIMLLLMFVSLSLLTGLSYYFSNRELTKSVNETAAAIGKDYSNRASAFVNELVVYVQDVTANPHIENPKNRQQIVDALADALQRNDKFTAMNYGDLEGNMIRAQGDTAYLGDRAYYQKAVQTKKMTISEPIISKGSGRLSIAIAVPIIKNEEVQAIIQATMPLDSLMDMVKEIKFMDSGYGFIIDQSGVILAHALNPELNGKFNLTESTVNPPMAKEFVPMDGQFVALFNKAVSSNKAIQGVYATGHGAIFTVFTPVELPGNAHWLLAVSAPRSEVDRTISRLNMILVLAALGCIVGGGLVIILISRRFARPEETYFKAFRHVADAIGIVNIENEKFMEANDAFFKILGYSQQDVIGCTSETFGLWANGGKRIVYDALLRQGVSVYNFETFWRTKNQAVRAGILSADVIKIGNVRYIVFIWHDVTEQKEAEAALQQSYNDMEQKVEERTQELLAANQELRAMNEEMIAMNEQLAQTNTALHEENDSRRQAEDKLLIRERQYRATTKLLTQPVDEAEQLAKTVLSNAVQLIGADGGFIGMYSEAGDFFTVHYGIGVDERFLFDRIPVKAGPIQTVYETGKIFRSPNYGDRKNLLGPEEGTSGGMSFIFVPLKQKEQVKGILAAKWRESMHEVTEDDSNILQQFADLAFLAIERARIQGEIRHMAFYDVVTGLPNSTSFNLRFAEELHKAKCGETKGMLLFINIDDFKSVNDTFGHSVGDEVLMAVGKYLRAAFIEEVFVSHISGDEFTAIVSGDMSDGKAAAIATRVLKQLCREYEVAEEQIQMSVSIGIVLYPQHGDLLEDLMKKADVALYAAKEAGKNCWHFFEAPLLQKAEDAMRMIHALRRGLLKNEFFLQYQPQLTADGAHIVGFEALLRWNSQDQGLVSPAQFIPLAERSDLIIEIGKWVFQEACCFAKKLADRGKSDIRVAINISPRQIKEWDFIDFVRTVIESNDVLPQQIELEVTENVLIDNIEDSVHKLKQLQEYGVTLAIDDFGTGFSSLTYLRTLPVKCLKIDKSFIDNIAFDEMQLNFVKLIIDLGHTLKMGIVAEGVETKEQLAKLEACQCDYIQGYIFSEAVSEEAAMNLCLKE